MPLAARLTTWPSSLLLGSLVFALVGTASAGIWLRRRFHPRGPHIPHQEAVETLFNNFAVLFTVLLAFMVVGVWEEFNKAVGWSDREPANVLSVYRMAETFPPGRARELRRAVGTYCQSVVDREFPAMGRMQRSPETDQAMKALWDSACHLAPANNAENDAHDKILDRLAEVQSDRMARLMTMDRGIPDALWMVILLFTGITVAFSVYLSPENHRPQRMAITAFALALALVLFAIIEMNYPFLGDVSVKADGFQEVLEAIRQYPG